MASSVLRIASLVAAVLFASPAAQSQPQPGIRGFSTASVGAQRDREARFRAIPKPSNLREYMQATSAEPHHAGGPGSRKVAEYILAKYKSWGLNAWIEEHEALLPFPTERVLEVLGPDGYHAKLEEPAVPGDPD